MHDGDTPIDATIHLKVQIRYKDFYSPELSEPGGKEAREEAKKVEGIAGRLYIPLDGAKSMADIFTFGRVIGDFYPDGSSISESERLVLLGHGSRFPFPKRGTVEAFKRRLII
jgi:hypothetical protein